MSAPHSADPGQETADTQPVPEPRRGDAETVAAGEGDRPQGTGVEPSGRRLSFRQLFLIGVSIAAVMGLVGLVVAYVAYDKATEIDRSTPGVVVRQYLIATFDERDEARARLFTCDDPKRLTEIQSLLADIQEREGRFGIKISVVQGGFDAKIDGAAATVAVRLKIQVPEEGGYSSESFQQWQFTTEQRSGWRVCDARRVG